MVGVLLLGAISVIVAKENAERSKRKRARKKAGTNEVTHIGTGNYDWPHRAFFPKEQSFWDWFEAHGYTSQSLIFPYRDMVEWFQHDYNKVRIYMEIKGFAIVLDMPRLKTDGRIGDGTVDAMVNVTNKILPSVHKEWQPLVEEAWASGSADPIIPPTPAPPPSLWGPSGKDCMIIEIVDDHDSAYHDVTHDGLTAFSVMGLQNDILNQTPGDSVLTLQAGSKALFLSYSDDHQHDVTVSEHKKQALSHGETISLATSFHDASAYKGAGHMHVVKIYCES